MLGTTKKKRTRRTKWYYMVDARGKVKYVGLCPAPKRKVPKRKSKK